MPPESPYGQALAPPMPYDPKYRPLTGRARAATRFVGLAVLAAAVDVAISIACYLLLSDVSDNPTTARAIDRIDLRDTLATASGTIMTVTYILGVIASLVWITRAYANVEALAPAHKRHWTGWAWLGWAIPIMNAFRPKQIANDIWRSGARAEPPFWLLAWWLLWIVVSIGDRVAVRTDLETVSDFRTFDLAFAGVSTLAVVTGVLWIMFIRRSTAMQEERAAQLPKDPEERRRFLRGGDDEDAPEGFTITPGWAPSETLNR